MNKLATIILIFLLISCTENRGKDNNENQVSNKSIKGGKEMPDKVMKSEDEWKGCLTEEEFRVLRKKGTEPAFTGKFDKLYDKGTYICKACGEALFSSETKFNSGSGWPSFWKPIKDNSIDEEIDKSYGMNRIEVKCSKCGGHLGHLFDDGPNPTGMRYCINSVSLEFKPMPIEEENKKDTDE